MENDIINRHCEHCNQLDLCIQSNTMGFACSPCLEARLQYLGSERKIRKLTRERDVHKLEWLLRKHHV